MWNADDDGITTIQSAEGVFAIVRDQALPDVLDERQFNPSGYPDAQPIVGKGGRGGAWFVETGAGKAVLKHYRRGGWAAKISADLYVFRGASASRSHNEYRLLKQLQRMGMPVPKPLAAFCLSHHGFYRAALLTQRITDSRSLVDAVSTHDAPWQRLGATLARFHNLAIRHADLNANNILIGADDAVHFIDWDKGRIDRAHNGWRDAVFARLIRSLRKEIAVTDRDYLEAGIENLTAAYRGAMA